MSARNRFRSHTFVFGVLALLASLTASARAGSSNWTFDGAIDQRAGDAALAYLNGTVTSSAVSFVSSTINGQSTTVMSIPAFSGTQGLALSPNVGPNGGSASYINQYTFGFDVNVTGSNWFAFYQTNPTNANDADFFKQSGAVGGIGISGNYSGSLATNVWARVMFSVDETAGSGGTMKKYINGVLVGTQNLNDGVDGRFSLYSKLNPTSPTLLFTSQTSQADTTSALINAVYFSDSVLTDAQVAAFGGASARGFNIEPAAVPEPASIVLLGVGAAAAVRRRRG